MRRIFLAAFLCAVSTSALAEGSPNLITGQVPTAAQWNQFFSAKQDVLGYSPVNKAGDTMTGRLTTPFSSATRAGFNITVGSTPSAPINGDIWATSAGLFVQVQGATVGPLSGTASSNVFTVPQTINTAGVTAPTADTGWLLQVLSAAATNSRIEATAAAASGLFTGRRANGTFGSPTTLVNNNLITSLQALGYDGTSWSAVEAGAFRIYAAGTWSNSSHPTKACLATTPSASVTIADSLCQQPTGGVLVGSPTGGDQGAGTLSAVALYDNGNRVLRTGTTVTVPQGGSGAATFTANLPILGNGTSAFTQGTRSGNTTAFVTTTGTLTTNDCVKIDANGNFVDSGASCGSSSNTPFVQDFLAGVGFTAGSTTSLVLSSTPTNKQMVMITFDGVVQQQTTWSLSTATVTFNAAIPASVQVVEAQWYAASTLSGVGSIDAKSGAVAADVTTNKFAYVSKAANASDANTGASWYAPMATIQAGINAVASNGTVYVGAGTYTITTAIQQKPGVRLICNTGVTITQGSAANVTPFVDFYTNVATGATIEWCKIDGNRDNNTWGQDKWLVAIAGSTPVYDVQVLNNTLVNAPGTAVYINNAIRPKVIGNTITNFGVLGVALVPVTNQWPMNGQILENTFSTIGTAAVYSGTADFNKVCKNNITGDRIGSPAAPLRVTTTASSTTINWLSGPTFSGAKVGQFVILAPPAVAAAGAEYQITTVNSTTQLTVSTSVGLLTSGGGGAPSVVGSGDLMTFGNSSYTLACDNTVDGGAVNGMVVHNLFAGSDAQKNIISRNIVRNSGGTCIQVAGLGSPNVTVATGTMIVENYMTDCGQQGTAGNSAYFDGIFLIGVSVINTFVNGNMVRDDAGTPTTLYWLSQNSVPASSTNVGVNTSIGPTNGTTIGGGIAVRSVSGGTLGP